MVDVDTDLGPRLRAAYRDAPRREQLHVAGRWRSCPFAAVEARVPDNGRVLDIGCGHGLFSLYLAMASPDRQVTGIDVDRKKIELAIQAAKTAELGNVQFEVAEPRDLPTGSWDAVTIVDVLYLLGIDLARRLVTAGAAAVAPGGIMLVKEMDERPRWKYRWNKLQELVATKVARITEGDHVQVVPPELIVTDMEQAGLTVSRHRLDRHSLHPHHLIVGHRPVL
ncbi:MAG TPA: class I SAM-dependent methyltransferase [Acidimicrobiales bacterium]|jgi:2-polyprenyl-3-methyl-5-hydroxy-6-metoxy-1,4-benzoquinol methylase